MQRELGAIKRSGATRARRDRPAGGRARAILESGRPWPGELERLQLGNGAGALRSQACEDYRLALEELQLMAAETYSVIDARCARRAAARIRCALHRAQAAALGARLLRPRAARRAVCCRRHEIGSRYRERFARVMVDEMQDTNRVQLELIDLVAGLDLVMVGDAQQSIYGFRHADVELFEERGRRLERIGARASLQTNFRSRPEILRALNGAFAEALGESFRPLAPGREDPPASGAAGRAAHRRQGRSGTRARPARRAARGAVARGRGASAGRAGRAS